MKRQPILILNASSLYRGRRRNGDTRDYSYSPSHAMAFRDAFGAGRRSRDAALTPATSAEITIVRICVNRHPGFPH